jgi:CRISPR system Cascade subunit CasE
MYISKIQTQPGSMIFDYINEHGGKGIYSDHQLLWSLFPDDPDAKRDFLYRKDINKGYPAYYIVSKRKPVSDVSFLKIATKEYKPKLIPGQKFSFCLRVNPVVAKKTEGVKNSKHHDIWINAQKKAKEEGLEASERYLFAENQAKKWLTDRSESLGFTVNSNALIIEGYNQFRFFKQNTKNHITIGVLDYSGIGEVINPDALLNTLYHGVRKSKAFGCGLMLIKLL